MLFTVTASTVARTANRGSFRTGPRETQLHYPVFRGGLQINYFLHTSCPLHYHSHRWRTQIIMSSRHQDLDLEASNLNLNTDGAVPESDNSTGNESDKSYSQDAKAEYIVEYDGPEDPLNPQNLPVWKKWSFAFILGFITLATTFASSVFSTATQAAADEFGVSNEVMTLGTALFILGVYHHSPSPL